MAPFISITSIPSRRGIGEVMGVCMDRPHIPTKYAILYKPNKYGVLTPSVFTINQQ
jgi:hypothetical protein